MKKEISRGEEIFGEDVFQILTKREVSCSNRYPPSLVLLQAKSPQLYLKKKRLAARRQFFASAFNTHLHSVDIPFFSDP